MLATWAKISYHKGMRDRQEFEKTVLPNGITFYTYQLDAPIASLEIQLPVGAAHSYGGNGFLNGSVHFLEHLQLIRSSLYPNAHELNREIGLRGGHFKGNIYRSKTTYAIDLPASELEFSCKALLDRVYHPVFDTEDIERERTVVANERDRERFYPGRSRPSQYYNTEFMFDMPYKLEQLYGSNDDLNAMSATRFQEMHQIITASQGTVALAVGNSDFSELKEALSAIPTTLGLLSKKMNDAHWTDPTFRYVPFDTIGRPTLEVAWIHPRVSQQERTAISFILSLLTNPVHGTLYQELRQKKGWVYSIDQYLTSHRQTIFGMSFPVNTLKQVEYLRGILADRIRDAIHNEAAVEQEIHRRLNSQVYNYQTAGSIMNQASHHLIGNKKIFTELEWQQAIEAMREPAWREEIITHFFKPEEMGEIGFTPA